MNKMYEAIYKRIIWFGLVSVMIFAPLAKGAVSFWAIIPIQIVIFSLVFLWLWNAVGRWNSSRDDRLPAYKQTDPERRQW